MTNLLIFHEITLQYTYFFTNGNTFFPILMHPGVHSTLKNPFKAPSMRISVVSEAQGHGLENDPQIQHETPVVDVP